MNMISMWTMIWASVTLLGSTFMTTQLAQATTTPFSRTATCSPTQIGTTNVYSCTASFKLPASEKATIESVNASCPVSISILVNAMSVTVNTVIGGEATSQPIPSVMTGGQTKAGSVNVLSSTATNYADAGSTVSATFYEDLAETVASAGVCTVVFVGEL